MENIFVEQLGAAFSFIPLHLIGQIEYLWDFGMAIGKPDIEALPESRDTLHYAAHSSK